MSGGFYNHYDDPDEFWDETPLEPSRIPAPAAASYATPPPAPPPRPATQSSTSGSLSSRDTGPVLGPSDTPMARLGITPPPRSVLVSVEVGADRLPTKITLGRSWKNSVEPTSYGRSIMDAYKYGLYLWAAQTVESGVLPPSTVLPLRDAAPALLRTFTIEEFRELYDHLFLDNPITVHGPYRNAHGQFALTVTATRSKLVSIELDPSWAQETDANFIAQDIIECCRKIRTKGPQPVSDVDVDQLSDSEVASRIVEHEHYLLSNG